MAASLSSIASPTFPCAPRNPIRSSRCVLSLAGRSSFPSHSRARIGIGAKDSPPRFVVSCSRESKAAVVTKETWEKSVLKSKVPVVVEFYASWCGPCKMVHRVMNEIAEEYAGRVECFVLNADIETQVAEEHDIKAVPVVLLFKNGQKRDTVVGTMPKDFYVAAIERVLKV